MKFSLEGIHEKNIVLFSLMSLFVGFDLFFELMLDKSFDLQASIPDLVGMLILLMSYLVIRKKRWIQATMYVLCFGFFALTFGIVLAFPYLTSMYFVWLCVPLCTVYQRYGLVVIAGMLNVAMTTYFFVFLRMSVFPGTGTQDYVYLMVCNVLLTVFFLYTIKITRGLQEKAEDNERKFKEVLQQTDVVSWSFDVHTKSLDFSGNIEKIVGYGIGMFHENSNFYRNIIHPEDNELVRENIALLHKGEARTYEHRLIASNGSIIWVENRSVPIKDKGGNIRKIEGFLIDCTIKNQKADDVRKLAYYDVLTGLPNYSNFTKRAEQIINSSKRTGENFALLFLDLDCFKSVNDNFGHEIGNEVLVQVARRLADCVRCGDFLCRLFGDEFIVLLPDSDIARVEEIAERVRCVIGEEFMLGETTVKISCSIGISLYPEHGTDIVTLMNRADQAMYGVKSSGKNDYGAFGEVG